MNKFLVLIIFISTSTSASASESPEIERQLKNSVFALGAFECSFLAPNSELSEKYFIAGLSAGRQFLEYTRKNVELSQKYLSPKAPFIWLLMKGGSDDFVLGQIYARSMRDAYKDFPADTGLWKQKKEERFSERNCYVML